MVKILRRASLEALLKVGNLLFLTPNVSLLERKCPKAFSPALILNVKYQQDYYKSKTEHKKHEVVHVRKSSY